MKNLRKWIPEFFKIVWKEVGQKCIVFSGWSLSCWFRNHWTLLWFTTMPCSWCYTLQVFSWSENPAQYVVWFSLSLCSLYAIAVWATVCSGTAQKMTVKVSTVWNESSMIWHDSLDMMWCDVILVCSECSMSSLRCHSRKFSKTMWQYRCVTRIWNMNDQIQKLKLYVA